MLFTHIEAPAHTVRPRFARKRRRAAVVMMLVGVLTLTACGLAGTSAPSSESTLTIGLGSEPDSLSVLGGTASSAVPSMEAGQLFESLTRVDSQGETVPWLLSEMPTSSDNGKSWNLALRGDVTWSDGTDLTAQDVADTIQATKDAGPAQNMMRFNSWDQGLEGIEVTGKDTLTLNYAIADPVLPSRLYLFRIQKVTGDLEDELIGTGPYVLDEWVRGQRVTLRANPDYWGETPQWEQVVFRYIPDQGARTAALTAGEIDLAPAINFDNRESVPATVSSETSNLNYAIVPNAREGLFASRELRQALNYAVDKESIAANLFGGLAQVEQGQFGDDSYVGYNHDLEAYPFDPEMARTLIAESGYDGQRFTLVSPSGLLPNDSTIAEAVVEAWNAVGLNAELELLDAARIAERAVDQERRPDVILLGRKMDTRDMSGVFNFVLDTGASSSNSDSGLSESLLAAHSEADPVTRAERFQAPLAEIYEQAYLVFLVRPGQLFGTRSGLEFDTPEAGFAFLRVDDVEAE